MAQACTDTEHHSRAGAILRRIAVYAGVTLATVGLVTAFAGSHADAADIDYTAASASEIEDHLADLESQRDEAAIELGGLQTRFTAARAVISAATADYGNSGAQLTVVTAEIESAEDDLDSKVTSLVAYAQEQSDKYEQAQAAAETAEALTIEIEGRSGRGQEPRHADRRGRSGLRRSRRRRGGGRRRSRSRGRGRGLQRPPPTPARPRPTAPTPRPPPSSSRRTSSASPTSSAPPAPTPGTARASSRAPTASRTSR